MRPTKAAPPRPSGPDAELPLANLPVDFLDSLNSALSDPNPVALLSYASSLLATIEPREAALWPEGPRGPDGPHSVGAPGNPAGSEEAGLTLLDFCTALDAAGLRQTDALLKVITTLADDEMLRERIRRSVAARRHALPGWTLRLDQMRPHRAYELTHLLGDGETLAIAVTLPGGREVSILAYVDHNMGTVVKDAFVRDEPIDGFLEQWAPVMAAQEPDSVDGDDTVRELSLADARARLSEAIDAGAHTLPPFETDTWPDIRSLVEWVLSAVPGGGAGYPVVEYGQSEQAAIMYRFSASPFAAELSDDDIDMVATIVSLASEHGPGDPLRWSSVAVEILLMDWVLGTVMAPRDFLVRAPRALRRLVGFAHAERGIPAHLTRHTLDAVHQFEPDFLAVIDDDDPMAELSAANLATGLDPSLLALLSDSLLMPRMVLDAAAEAVGGMPALETLSVAALPDENADLTGVPADLHDRLGEILALTDSACEALFPAELRTACRRLTVSVATADPAIFRRKASPVGAAAALVWMIARENELMGQRGLVSTLTLADFFGLSTVPKQRSEPMFRALGLRPNDVIGDPRLLISPVRRHWATMRDQYRPGR